MNMPQFNGPEKLIKTAEDMAGLRIAGKLASEVLEMIGEYVVAFIITTLVANKDYWKHIFWMPGIPVPMKLFLAPIEFLGIFIKPISLMIRLFANISAGHIIILSLISLIFIFKSVWLAPASLFFSVFISLIEVLVVAIQAYIFTMLSALYIGSAIEEHEH